MMKSSEEEVEECAEGDGDAAGEYVEDDIGKVWELQAPETSPTIPDHVTHPQPPTLIPLACSRVSQPVPWTPAHRPATPQFPKTPNAPPDFCPCPAPILVSPDATLANSNASLANSDASLANSDASLANSDASLANSDGPLANFDAFPTAADTYPGSPKPRESTPLFPIFATHHQLNTLPAFPNDPNNVSAWPDPRLQPTPAHSVKLCQAPPLQPTYPEVLWYSVYKTSSSFSYSSLDIA
ncbi:hypothetical protein E4T56_gene1250 [Termitomyces sp. T112]|nr:hypothetical protein E4T56_gene1250 [Termitomyces sp. T112]